MPTETIASPLAAIGVGASAGGVEALTGFVRALPRDLKAVVLIVLHLPDAGPSVLPSILARAATLPVVHAGDGTKLRGGLVIVAPPGQHLLVRGGRAVLDHGPRENGHRPSADALFRSLANEFGARSAGVVLSGTMDDGAAGLRAVELAGGLTIVQEPAEAAFPGMPAAAIAESPNAIVCRVAEMSALLTRWMAALPPPNSSSQPHVPKGIFTENPDMTEVSEFTCPECGGTLFLETDLGTERFRCRVGHSFSSRGLFIGKHDALESALWAAIVALEERADLSRKLLKRLEGFGRPSQMQRYRDDIEQSAERVEIIRDLIKDLLRFGLLPGESEEDGTDASE